MGTIGLRQLSRLQTTDSWIYLCYFRIKNPKKDLERLKKDAPFQFQNYLLSM